MAAHTITILHQDCMEEIISQNKSDTHVNYIALPERSTPDITNNTMTPPLQPSLRVLYGCTKPDAKDDIKKCTTLAQALAPCTKNPKAAGLVIGDSDHAATNNKAREDVGDAKAWI